MRDMFKGSNYDGGRKGLGLCANDS
jgi:hypothetical protein